MVKLQSNFESSVVAKIEKDAKFHFAVLQN